MSKPCGPKANHVELLSHDNTPLVRINEDRSTFLRSLALLDGCTQHPIADLETLSRDEVDMHAAALAPHLLRKAHVLGNRERLMMRLRRAGQSGPLSSTEMELHGPGVVGLVWWRRDSNDSVELDVFVTALPNATIAHIARGQYHIDGAR